ncbi:energy-coupling factor transporter transmembrane component T [Caminibacter pacificus]
MKDNFLKIAFIALFFLFLSLRDIKIISFLLALLIIVTFIIDKNLKIFFKALKSILLFNLGVSLGYIILAYFKHINPWHYILYINLKVILMTYYVFWFFSKVSIVRFFSFSKELSYLLTITLSQIFSYKKTFTDFRDAFRARVVNVRDKEKTFITNTFKFFLTKAMKDSKERALAMKARGFFEEGEK